MPRITKYILLATLFFASISISAQREEITFEELLKRIHSSVDSNVYIENIYVNEYNSVFSEMDENSDKINIDKNVEFKNVIVSPLSDDLSYINFRGNVSIVNSFLNISNSIFEKNLVYKIDNEAFLDSPNTLWGCMVNNSKFYGSVDINIDNAILKSFSFYDNEILSLSKSVVKRREIGYVFESGLRVTCQNLQSVDFSSNIVEINALPFSFIVLDGMGLNFISNTIESEVSFIRIDNIDGIDLYENIFKYPFILMDISLKQSDYVEWYNLSNKIVNGPSYHNIFEFEVENYYLKSRIDSLINYFLLENDLAYNNQILQLGKFFDFYKSQHNKKWSNLVYQEMKQLETKRLNFIYQNEKNFDNFFQLKLNQFIKVFSDYGTKPSKAIIIAVYVIFFFAIFYLFFPNSWDENNKHRIINRMLFFTKYFSIKEGMKEVYEEGNRTKVMAYDDFKNYLESNKTNVPPYFISLSKPIYALSVANYRIRSKILGKADILKGKWSELPPRRKVITSTIMAFWLLGILLYDLFVKFFNALMLSINTFSTLGFGEIPIKGIPRYLAILQGFLGWFMLSIFSVSLISQLLN